MSTGTKNSIEREVMPKRIILIDLDLTLIDRDYRPTIPVALFTDQSSRILASDDLIGLISDSPYKTLQQWMDTFRFNGPIVAEKGALIVWPSGQLYETQQRKIDWDMLKAKISFSISEQFVDALVIEEYYLSFFESNKRIPTGSSLVVLINPYRRYSFGIHVRMVDQKGRLVQNNRLFNQVYKTAMAVVAQENIVPLLDIDSNPMYSVLILADKTVNKDLAIPVLREQYPGREIIAIGDGASDMSLKGVVDKLCAVGNAQDDFKKVADIVAVNDITAGVLEILQKFS